jgi:hypothetical protein
LVQQNGEVLEKPLLLVMLIDRTRIKLYKGRKTIAKEDYTSIIQVIFLNVPTQYSELLLVVP